MSWLRNRMRQAHHDDSGAIGLMLAVLALGLLAMVGLVVDGAGKARALTRADDVAAAAARAGAQAVDIGDVRAGTSTGANPARARSAARDYLDAAGMTGSIEVTDSGRTLTVNATAPYSPVFLAAIGVGQMNVTGTATVDLVQVQQGELR
jgi:Flp pilus assembly protein TadG